MRLVEVRSVSMSLHFCYESRCKPDSVQYTVEPGALLACFFAVSSCFIDLIHHMLFAKDNWHRKAPSTSSVLREILICVTLLQKSFPRQKDCLLISVGFLLLPCHTMCICGRELQRVYAPLHNHLWYIFMVSSILSQVAVITHRVYSLRRQRTTFPYEHSESLFQQSDIMTPLRKHPCQTHSRNTKAGPQAFTGFCRPKHQPLACMVS